MGEWWETFFDEAWLRGGFGIIRRKRTLADTRFIVKALSLKRRSRILDVCCGVGRHAIELAGLGFNVTGVDLSETYLKIARDRAHRRGLGVEFKQCDMRQIERRPRFDAAICMWTSFGYFERDADNLKALQAVNRALKSGGKFLIELMNRDWAVVNFEPTGWYKTKGGYVLENRKIDTVRSRMVSQWTFIDDGREVKRNFSLRLYSPHELVGLLEKAGLRLSALFGDRQARTPTWEHRMTAVLARKP